METARARFAQDGYAGATIRKIAADAGVDASLVMQLFGSKEALFAAVMSITPNALNRLADAFNGPLPAIGERVTRAFFAVWEGDPADSEPLLAMLRGAATTEQAARQLSEFIEARLLTEVRLELPDHGTAQTRVALACSMLVGVMFARRLVQVPTLVDTSVDVVVGLIAPVVQALLTGD